MLKNATHCAPTRAQTSLHNIIFNFAAASPVLGWVPVIVESQDGIHLGQTEIYYEDQVEDVLQQIVENPTLQKRLFDKYNRYYNLGGSLETSGGEVQNSGTLGKLILLSNA